MANNLYAVNNFTGGMADGTRVGYTGSFNDGIGLDYRSDPDKLGVLHALKKESSTTVVDSVKWMEEYLGYVFAYGNAGNIYRRNTSAVWSNIKTVSNSTGQGIAIFNDSLWYANNDGIGKATAITTSPVFSDDYFKSLTTDYLAGQQQTAANTYSVPTSITETAANKRDFTPTKNYVSEIMAAVVTASTGDLTCTVHDVSNNIIAQDTLLNADFAAVGSNEVRFRFNGGFTVTSGTTYHFHITQSAGATTLRTNTAADLSTVRYIVVGSQNDLDVDQSSLQTLAYYNVGYAGATAINEAAKNYKTFVPQVSSLTGISLLVYLRGTTGSWQITVHDDMNTVIGQTTAVGFASLTDVRDYWYKFTFPTPLTLNVGQTYHFHLTTGAGTTALTATSADLSTVFFKTHFSVLESDTRYHPMKVLGSKLCIGNANYLATIDDSEIYTPQVLQFPKGESVRALEAIGDYLAIATWRGTSIGDYGTSRVYFWDGVAPTFNQFIDFDGQVNAMLNSGNNQLYVIAGTTGRINMYTGAINKMRQVKFLENTKTLETWPGAMTSWEGLIYFGISDGTSTVVQRVVYSYGQKDKDNPTSLNKDYPISSGVTNSNAKITCLKGISATTFLVAWYDGTNYGVDNIDVTNYQTTMQVATLRFDGDLPNHLKLGHTVSCRFAQLTANQGFKLEYRITGDTGTSITWTTLANITAGTSTNLGYKSFSLAKRFFEIEFRITMTTSDATTPPTFLSLVFDYEFVDKTQLGGITYV